MKGGPKTERQWANVLGLFSPEMKPHWDRLWSEPSGHAFVNIGTEWTRLDPQRAFKVGAVVIAVLTGLVFL